MNDRTKYLDDILNEFEQIVEKHFPEFVKSGSGYSGSQFHIDLSSETKFLEPTPYFYKGNLKFIHWTSIDNLISIINTGEIRFYNLINSADETEFEYGSHLLGLSKDHIEFIKNNYFTFSFCTIEELHNSYLWNSYGKDQTGVAIEFSIINTPLEWDKYFISKLHYELPNKFQDYQTDIITLKEKYGNQIELKFDIWQFAGFHKQISYSQENEIRISICFPFNWYEVKLKSERKQFKIDGKKNRIVTYIPLKLWIDFDKAYPKGFHKNEDYQNEVIKLLSSKPQIKIENIYFGRNCGLQNEEYYSIFREALIEMVSFQLGYNLDLPLNLFDI